jgi:hypothetical protein
MPFPIRFALAGIALVPFVLVAAQQGTAKGPTAEQVYKNIKVFNGVPANDIIPAMEFMSASLNYRCTDCHDPKDYAIDTPKIATARRMIQMQRDINEKNFNGRNEVTCMTCHSGSQAHPESTPIPTSISLRHEQLEPAPEAADVFKAHIAALGDVAAPLVRTGTLTAPNDVTHKVETLPLELIQAPGGKFRLISGERKVGSDGTKSWYGEYPLTDEPEAIFGRMGRSWRGEGAFAGLERFRVMGKSKVGRSELVVVRGNRPSTFSTEELYFDPKTKLLQRLVNIRRSTIGTVVTSVDYSNFRTVGGGKAPMRVVVTFAGGEQWIMDFKTAKIDPSIADSVFKGGA